MIGKLEVTDSFCSSNYIKSPSTLEAQSTLGFIVLTHRTTFVVAKSRQIEGESKYEKGCPQQCIWNMLATDQQ